jgi:hypothetical protein
VVDVERKPDGDAALGDIGDRARNETRGRLLKVEVVEREIERFASRGDELSGEFGDLERRLTAVRQGADVDRQA